jgi:hypothetical protein
MFAATVLAGLLQSFHKVGCRRFACCIALKRCGLGGVLFSASYHVGSHRNNGTTIVSH